jgi:hypothetical protein
MEWKDLAQFMYGRGFWYTDPLNEIRSLSEEQLLWTPTDGTLPILWHVGHIAHREALHIGCFIAGLSQDDLVPPECGVFTDWESVDHICEEIDSVTNVLQWVKAMRERCHGIIDGLTDADLDRSAFGEDVDSHLTVAHWLAITPVHTGVHIGRIQGLRAQLEGTRERAC